MPSGAWMLTILGLCIILHKMHMLVKRCKENIFQSLTWVVCALLGLGKKNLINKPTNILFSGKGGEIASSSKLEVPSLKGGMYPGPSKTCMCTKMSRCGLRHEFWTPLSPLQQIPPFFKCIPWKSRACVIWTWWITLHIKEKAFRNPGSSSCKVVYNERKK